MDAEARDLHVEEFSITHCPVLVLSDDDLVDCATPLVPVVTRTLRGDDYGEWSEYRVSFPCGHSLVAMTASYRHREFV